MVVVVAIVGRHSIHVGGRRAIARLPVQRVALLRLGVLGQRRQARLGRRRAVAVGVGDHWSPAFELVHSPREVRDGAPEAGDLVRLLQDLLFQVRDPLL